MHQQTEPSISVVVPTCDRPDLLLETIHSIRAQTYAPKEIIIIDNGYKPIPRDSKVFNYNVRYVRALPRFGVAQARNLGAVLATGDYLAFLDDDDVWAADYLAAIVEKVRETGVSIVLGCLKDLNSGRVIPAKSGPIPPRAEFIAELHRRNPGAVGSNTVVRRDVFMLSAGYDPYLTTNQDKALVLDLVALKKARVARAGNAFVYFRQDGQVERQTEIWKRAKGRSRFLYKYWRDMSWGNRVHVLAQCIMLRWRSFLIKIGLLKASI